MAGRLENKVAIITGAGTGVGRACVERFAQEGARIVAVGRTKATLEEAIACVPAGRAIVHVGDTSLDDTGEAVAKAAEDAFGKIDILVHSAGVGYSWAEKSPDSMNDTIRTPPDKWREVMAINLDGYYLIVHAVLPRMIAAGGGAIVAVTSLSGMLGLPGAHAYTAAKAGMINLTRSLCVTHAMDNIRANCIAPGYIDTPMIASVMGVFDDPAVADRLTPMRRAGTPMEMANGCLYLASDEASYCNGTVLVIDGGTSARQ